MKNGILTVLWLSWVFFCGIIGLIFKLLPVKYKIEDFELEETVCGLLHKKGILTDEEMEYEQNSADTLPKLELFGYWVLVSTILPILRKSDVINPSVTFFTKRWISDSKASNLTSKIILWNSRNIGKAAGKTLYLFEKYPLFLRFSPIISLASLTLTSVLIETPHYLAILTGSIYSIVFAEAISKYSKVEIKHSKSEVYITSILLLLTYIIMTIKSTYLGVYGAISLGVIFGFIQGSLGFTLGHEIGHKKGLFNKVLSKLLFTFSGYPQFWEVHNHVHHRYIGTSNDNSTAKKGQALLNFIGNQFKLYIKHLKVTNLIILITPFIFFTEASIFIGTTMMISWVLLEVINFIQHYGLVRDKHINEHLSWDTNNLFSNAYLFNLGRHGHHHYKGSLWHHTLDFKSNNVIKEGYLMQTIYAIAGV